MDANSVGKPMETISRWWRAGGQMLDASTAKMLMETERRLLGTVWGTWEMVRTAEGRRAAKLRQDMAREVLGWSEGNPKVAREKVRIAAQVMKEPGTWRVVGEAAKVMETRRERGEEVGEDLARAISEAAGDNGEVNVAKAMAAMVLQDETAAIGRVARELGSKHTAPAKGARTVRRVMRIRGDFDPMGNEEHVEAAGRLAHGVLEKLARSRHRDGAARALAHGLRYVPCLAWRLARGVNGRGARARIWLEALAEDRRIAGGPGSLHEDAMAEMTALAGAMDDEEVRGLIGALAREELASDTAPVHAGQLAQRSAESGKWLWRIAEQWADRNRVEGLGEFLRTGLGSSTGGAEQMLDAIQALTRTGTLTDEALAAATRCARTSDEADPRENMEARLLAGRLRWRKAATAQDWMAVLEAMKPGSTRAVEDVMGDHGRALHDALDRYEARNAEQSEMIDAARHAWSSTGGLGPNRRLDDILTEEPTGELLRRACEAWERDELGQRRRRGRERDGQPSPG